jgi:hypothetical protein
MAVAKSRMPKLSEEQLGDKPRIARGAAAIVAVKGVSQLAAAALVEAMPEELQAALEFAYEVQSPAIVSQVLEEYEVLKQLKELAEHAKQLAAVRKSTLEAAAQSS